MTTPVFKFDPSSLSLNQVRVLRNIRDLAHLVPPTHATFYIFDIDETIYQNKHSPCQMMKERGLNAYQSALNSPQYKHLSFQQKSKLTKTLQVALQTKIPVESDTIEFLHSLQQKGVPVFALTARYSHMASVTKKELASLNINLVLTSPFPKDEILRDEESEAIYDSGIIFTNAHEKGPVLNRFLHTLFGNTSALSSSLHDNSGSNSARSLFSSSQAMAIPSSRGNNNNSKMSSRASQSQRSVPNSLSHLPKTPVLSSTPPSNSIPNSLMSLPPPLLVKGKNGNGNEDVGMAIVNNSNNNNTNNNQREKEKQRRESLRDGMMFDSDEEDSSYPADVDDDENNNNNSGRVRIPEKIVFIDDRFQNCASLLSGLSIADRLRISIHTFHYQSPSSALHAMEAELTPQLATELFEFQISHFIATGNILDDQQTRMAKQSQMFGEMSINNNNKNENSMEDDTNMASGGGVMTTPNHHNNHNNNNTNMMSDDQKTPQFGTPESSPHLRYQDVGSTPIVVGNHRSGAITPVSLSTPVHHPQSAPSFSSPQSVGSTPLHSGMREFKNNGNNNNNNMMPVFDLLSASSSVAADKAAAAMFAGMSSPQPIPNNNKFQKNPSRDPRLSTSATKPSSSRSSISSSSSPSSSPSQSSTSTPSGSPTSSSSSLISQNDKSNGKSPPNSLKSNSFGKSMLSQV